MPSSAVGLEAAGLAQGSNQGIARARLEEGTSPADSATGYVSRPLPASSGHALTFAGLWLFTLLLIFRPAETLGLPGATGLSFGVAALTLITFGVSQLWLEGRVSAWPREVVLVLALCAWALLSMQWAINPGESMTTFLDRFIKAVLMFVVMINAVRTEKRLLGLLWLVLAAGIWVSFGALDAFRQGQFSDEGYRVRGTLGGTLNDPNDTALFLVTMIPVALALTLSARGRGAKLLCAGCALFMIAAVVVTYSRGGFLALSCACVFLGWKLFRRAPLATGGFAALAIFAVIALLPGNYAGRLASIIDPDLDPHATSTARRNLLERSIQVASQHPIVGVGMGNFPMFSIKSQVSHNAYTQVASEMGLPALALYLAFITAPLGRLRRIERETEGVSDHEAYRRLHWLAVGLQASLIGFMIGSFFLSVAYYWFVYYLVGYAVCLGRIYETGPGRVVGRFEAQMQGVGP